MKQLLLLLLVSCVWKLEAQEVAFEHFRLDREYWGEKGSFVYILPENMERAFEPLKQSAEYRDFLRHAAENHQSYYMWIELNARLKKEASTAEARAKAVPDGLKKRLVKSAKKRNVKSDLSPLLLRVSVLADKHGKVQAVWFLASSAVVDLIKEKELERICKTIRKKPVEVSGGYTPDGGETAYAVVREYYVLNSGQETGVKTIIALP